VAREKKTSRAHQLAREFEVAWESITRATWILGYEATVMASAGPLYPLDWENPMAPASPAGLRKGPCAADNTRGSRAPRLSGIALAIKLGKEATRPPTRALPRSITMTERMCTRLSGTALPMRAW
jgi:hypothetical protein